MIVVTFSDPSVESVTAYGGTRLGYSPNPKSFGIATGANAILVDISASITTNGKADRLARRGEKFPST